MYNSILQTYCQQANIYNQYYKLNIYVIKYHVIKHSSLPQARVKMSNKWASYEEMLVDCLLVKNKGKCEQWEAYVFCFMKFLKFFCPSISFLSMFRLHWWMAQYILVYFSGHFFFLIVALQYLFPHHLYCHGSQRECQSSQRKTGILLININIAQLYH